MQSFHTHPLGAAGWIARAIQCVSAIIVLGITAWAARDTKTVTVIYSVTIVCFSLDKEAANNIIELLTKISGCVDTGDSGRCDNCKLHHKAAQVAYTSINRD
jgi:hypothetical protein